MTDEQKVLEFIGRLNALTKETGLVLVADDDELFVDGDDGCVPLRWSRTVGYIVARHEWAKALKDVR